MEKILTVFEIILTIAVLIKGSVVLPQTGPTIIPAPEFDAERDAIAIYKAIKGLGTDENAIIAVFATRNLAQRKKIANKYKSLYQRDLLTVLKDELTGDLETLVISMFKEPFELFASELQAAMIGFGTDENTLNEILCSHTVQDIQKIKTSFKSQFSTTLERQFESETSGNYKKMLHALIKNPRYTITKPQQARPAAAKLIKAANKFFGADVGAFIKVFSESPFPMIKSISLEYFKQTKKSTLRETIASKISGDTKNALLSILDWAEDPILYYVMRLHIALDKMFPNKRTVIRIIVNRAEVDLASIETKYQQIHHKSLHTVIGNKLSGDLKAGILTILDGNRS